MKKILFAIFFSACGIAVTSSATAQSTLVHYWHFNNVVLPTSGTFTVSILPSSLSPLAPGHLDADYTRISSPMATVVYQPEWAVSSAYTSMAAIEVADSSDTLNAQFGEGFGNCLKTRNRCDSMELLFYIPSTNYQNIKFSFATERSAPKGAYWEAFQYSADSGATWQSSGLSVTSDSVWGTMYNLISVNLTDVAAVNNPRLVFQITFFENDTFPGYSGNDRFDNITVKADTFRSTAVAPPAAVINFEGAIALTPNPATDYIDLSTQDDDNRMVTIYNAAGQTVFAGFRNGKNCRLDISRYSAGTYYIKATVVGTKNTQTLKFEKK